MVDDTGKSIKATLWGETAENFDKSKVGSLIAVKSAQLGAFNGKSLSFGQGADISYDNNSDERCKELSKWWFENGNQSDFQNLSSSQGAGSSRASEWKHMVEVGPEQIANRGNDPLWFTSKATSEYIHDTVGIIISVSVTFIAKEKN